MDLTTLNLFIKYLSRPIHFFGMLGFVFNMCGILALLWSFWQVLVGDFEPSSINVPLALSFLLIAAGFQFVFYGLLANMVVRTGDKKNSQLRDYFSNGVSH